jgi:hypothetical protein
MQRQQSLHVRMALQMVSSSDGLQRFACVTIIVYIWFLFIIINDAGGGPG